MSQQGFPNNQDGGIQNVVSTIMLQQRAVADQGVFKFVDEVTPVQDVPQ
jgi:hypothetical protein